MVTLQQHPIGVLWVPAGELVGLEANAGDVMAIAGAACYAVHDDVSDSNQACESSGGAMVVSTGFPEDGLGEGEGV